MESSVAKISFVERALWEGVVPRPDCVATITPTWVQQTTPRAPTAYMNGVYRCELSEDLVVEKIRRTIEHYKELTLPFRWKVAPSSRPHGLKELLVQNGLILKETLYGLRGDPASLRIPVNPAVEIAELSQHNIEDWLRVQAEAWRVPQQGIEHMRRTTTASLVSGEKTHLNYIAYYHNHPVASASVRLFNDYALLMGGAVHPELRQKGIYKTLLSYRMQVLKERKLPSVIHCLAHTSAPICMRLGFEKVCEIESYELP